MANTEQPRTLDPAMHIRNRPTMYVGSTGQSGKVYMVYEVVANAIDQFLAGRVSRIGVQIDRGTIIVFDDGDGFPFERPSEKGLESLVEDYVLRPHTTRSVDDHAPHIHLTLVGVGLWGINALSSAMTIQSVQNGTGWEQRFIRGERVGPACEVGLDFERGTRVVYTLDSEIFEAHDELPISTIRQTLFYAAHVFAGLHLQFNDEHFYAPNGLADLIPALVGSPSNEAQEIVSLDVSLEDMTISFAASRRTEPVETPMIKSWVNGSLTVEGGSHVDGALDVIRERGWHLDSMLLSVIMLTPEFAGPTKGRLNVPHVRPLIADALRNGLPDSLPPLSS